MYKVMPIDRGSRIAPLLLIIFTLLLIAAGHVRSEELTAKQIVVKANDLLHGKSNTAVATMTVVKPDWSREVSMKLWALEPDFALILITDPAKDRGSVTLKRQTQVWNWIPSIQRVIKIPPSMMLQPWMGSDFTNDDLVRESSIVEDYNQTSLGSDSVGGYDCYKIQLNPKPEAGVVWGKVIMWVSKTGFMEMKVEYYDEDSTLVKYMIGSNVRDIGDRTLPMHWEMHPVDKPNEMTVLDYSEMKFDVALEPSFFSERNMKRVK